MVGSAITTGVPLTISCVTHRRLVANFFLFFLALPDFPVSSYQVWDIDGSGYYGVTAADREEIYRSPFRFYDHRIKALFREMLLNQDPEATADWNWTVQGRRLADLQAICELVLITLTGPELILARGRDLLEQSREIRHPVVWALDHR